MGSDGAARVTLIRKIQTDLKSHFAHHKPDSKERAFQRDKRRNTGGIQFATTRKSCMDTTDKNTLTATLIIINESPSIFWRDDLTAELPHKGFPAKLPRNSQTVLTLKGSPRVPQDINIDYNIKKIVFSDLHQLQADVSFTNCLFVLLAQKTRLSSTGNRFFLGTRGVFRRAHRGVYSLGIDGKKYRQSLPLLHDSPHWVTNGLRLSVFYAVSTDVNGTRRHI